MRLFVIAGCLVSLLMATPTEAQPRASGVPLLVSTSWLAERLRDPGLVILWTGQGQRDAGLIAGARPMPHELLMTMGGGGHDLPATENLVAALESAGVSNDSHVVVYGEPLAAGWLFFALDYLGHDRISMLDGGIDKWRAEGRPVVIAAAPVTRGRFKPTLRPRLKATADDVQAQTGSGLASLLDARTTKEYEAGRIPGARLLSWLDLYADPKLQVFKSREALVGTAAGGGRDTGHAGDYLLSDRIALERAVLRGAVRRPGCEQLCRVVERLERTRPAHRDACPTIETPRRGSVGTRSADGRLSGHPRASAAPRADGQCTCGPSGARWMISMRVPQGSVM